MRSLLFLAMALAAAPVFAQADAPLARTADTFRDDLSGLARLATTAALVHERTGAFPASPFALLGSPEADGTAARDFRLSVLDVTAAGDSLAMRYVPLPVAPYVRENLVVTATVRRAPDGRYTVRHEMRRFEADADGGGRLLYDRAGVYRVERGYGDLCIDAQAARTQIAARTYTPMSALVATTAGDLTLRVHPPGEAAPVFYEAATRQAP